MKKTIFITLLVLAAVAWLPAQERAPLVEGYYTVGDQTFSISAGPMIPLFFTSLAGEGFTPASAHFSHLVLFDWSGSGAGLDLGPLNFSGTLEWGSYINNNLNLGGSLGISFLSTVNNRTLYMIPIMAVGSWYFHADRFDFPVSVGLGGAVLRLDEDSAFAPLVKLGGGALYNYNQDWSFGVQASYVANAELYAGTLASSNQIAHYAQVGLTALYHF